MKKQIKANLPWNDTAEAEFLKSLRDELTKCETFQADKAAESMRKIDTLEKEVHAFVDKQAAEAEQDAQDREAGDMERDVRSHRDDDGGSDDDDDDDDEGSTISETEAEERFKDFEDQVATLVADVHDLALFTKLNFTGFQKIVKKHDVSTGSRPS